MNWLLRFSLGLPSRPVDVAEMQRDVPELLDPKWPNPNQRGDWPGVFLRRSGPVLDDPGEFANLLRAWAAEAPRVQGGAPPGGGPGASACEHPECPRRPATKAQGAEPAASDARSSDVPGLAHLMVVGGGPGQKSLLARFLELVGRVHADAGEARKVVVTDPYLLTDSSERGSPVASRTSATTLEHFDSPATRCSSSRLVRKGRRRIASGGLRPSRRSFPVYE